MSDKPKVDRSAKRAPSMLWKKGESGNPGGKSPRVGPNGETLTEMARSKTLAMLEVLESIALDKAAENKDRISAANSVLNRGWGAVKPAADPDEPGGGKTIGEELLALLAARLPD